MIGDHTVTLYPLGGAAVDVTCLVDQVAIRHGRDDADSQPEASAATLDLTPVSEDVPMPVGLEVGATIVVTTSTVADEYERFRGRVTDVSFGWEEAGEHTPNRPTGQVIAVGGLADLGRRIVGDTPWPQQLDGARVAAVLAAADVVLDPLYSDPGTVQILARDVDSRAALEVATGTAESANGILWQTRDGEIRYADADHRRGIPVALSLDACDVLVTPVWRRSSAALLNKVSLGYGPVPEEGEQARYVAESPASVARFGRYELTTETELADQADATAMGELLLTRNAQPVWIMSELPLDMKGLDPGQTDALLGMDMHALVVLTGLPAVGAAPTTANLWVEGWAETLAWGTHEITLAVTGYCRTVPAPRWNDLDPAWTWDGQATLAAARNLIDNPSFEIDMARWTTTRGTFARVPGAGHSGGYVARYTASGTAGGNYFQAGSALPRMPVVGGDTYTGSMYLSNPSVVTRKWRVLLYFFDAADVATVPPNIVGADTPVPAGGTRIFATGKAPANAASCYARFFCVADTMAAGETVDFDAVLLEQSDTLNPYFDGDTPDTEVDGVVTTYAWSGTPHLSPSTQDTLSGAIPGTWDEATCLGPPLALGRWDDTPASTRWDLVPAGTTWNTWK